MNGPPSATAEGSGNGKDPVRHHVTGKMSVMQRIDRHPGRVAWIVFALSFLVIFAFMDRELNVYDEGIVLVDAMRTNAGEVLHRDYYSVYGPGAYLIVALLMKITPYSFIAARLYGVAVCAGIVAVTSRVLLGTLSFWFAAVGVLSCGMLLVGCSNYYLYPSFPCILLALGGAALLLPTDAIMRRTPVLLAGGCAGLAAYFRYDAGFFILLAYAIGFIILARVEHERGWAAPIRSAILCGAGALIVFTPALLVYLATAPVAAFYHDIVDFPLHLYARMRGLPWPTGREALRANNIGSYLPFLATGLGIVEGIVMVAAGTVDARSQRRFCSVVLFTSINTCLLYKGLVRISTLGMILALVPALIVLATCGDGWWRRGLSGRVAAVIVALCAMMPASLYAASGVNALNKQRDRIMGYALVTGTAAAPTACETGPTLYLAEVPDAYGRVAHYLRRYADPREPIFVGLDRHDRSFANPIALYFEASRLPGTHWHHFDPGLQTRPDIQKAIISDLVGHDVRWVVRDASFSNVREPNESARSSGAFILDHFLDSRFRRVAVQGQISIWLRRNVPPPTILHPESDQCLPREYVK